MRLSDLVHFRTSCRSNTKLICWFFGLLLVGLFFVGTRSHANQNQQQVLLKKLSSKSFKVRLKAVVLIGTHKIQKGKKRLQHFLNDDREKPEIRGAAAFSLAQLEDESSREKLTYLLGHASPILSLSCEKGLILLDKTKTPPVVVLIALEKPIFPQKGFIQKPYHQKIVVNTLAKRLERTGGVVQAWFEHQVLDPLQMERHLQNRGLVGYVARPKIEALTSHPKNDRTIVAAQVSLTALRLPGRKEEFSGGGSADAWMEGGQLSSSEQQELEEEVLEKAADSALMQFLEYLASQ